MKLLLFSDLHLDSAFAWLGGNRVAARRLRNALRETLSGILRLAQQEQVDAVLCAGDLYEQERFAPVDTLFALPEVTLFAAVVQLIALESAQIKYSTVQNWYPGDEQGRGGIYNLSWQPSRDPPP